MERAKMEDSTRYNQILSERNQLKANLEHVIEEKLLIESRHTDLKSTCEHLESEKSKTEQLFNQARSLARKYKLSTQEHANAITAKDMTIAELRAQLKAAIEKVTMSFFAIINHFRLAFFGMFYYCLVFALIGSTAARSCSSFTASSY